MYKVSEEAKTGMHATPEQMGDKLEGLPNDITRCSDECPFSVNIRVLPSTLTPLELEAFNIEAWEAWYNDSKNLNPYVPVPKALVGHGQTLYPIQGLIATMFLVDVLE